MGVRLIRLVLIYCKELGLQRIEAQTGLTLSRHIGTPNIASKGKLEPRTVRVPTALLLNSSKQRAEPLTPAQEAVADIAKGGAVKGEGANALDRLLPDSEKAWDDGRRTANGKKSLIEEVEPDSVSAHEHMQPKSILKKPISAGAPSQFKQPIPPAVTLEQKEKEKRLLIPLNVAWEWEKQDSGRIVVTIHMPDMVRTCRRCLFELYSTSLQSESSITSGSTFLDIEPWRILLTIPLANGETGIVDIDRSLSDAELAMKLKERASVISERVRSPQTSPVRNEASLEDLNEEIQAECEEDIKRMLSLKKEREFDVDGATAQWFVKDKKLVLTL